MPERLPRRPGFDSGAAAIAALNAVGHFVGLLSVDGVVLEVNAAALTAGGLQRDEVVGRPFWEARWWSHDPAVQQQLRDAVAEAASGTTVAYRVAVLAADAGRSLAMMDFRLTPLLDADGEVAFLVPEGEPVSDQPVDAPTAWAQLVAESHAARDEADRLRDLAARLAEAHQLDEVVAVILDHGARVLGVERCYVGVRADAETVRLWHPTVVAPGVAQRWSQVPLTAPTPMTDAIRTGADVWLDDLDQLTDRFPVMVDDARRAGLQAFGAFVVHDRFRQPQAAIGVGCTDPNTFDPATAGPVIALCGAALQRALVNQQAERIAALMDVLVRQAPLGIGFLDAELRFALVNDRLAEINGVPAGDHLGKTVADVLPALAEDVLPLLEQVLRENRPLVGLTLTGRTAATPERDRTWEEAFYPVVDTGGGLLGIGAIVVDVTDRLDGERRLADLAERLRLAMQISSAGVYEWEPDTGRLEWTDEYAALYGLAPGVARSIETWLSALHPDDRPLLSAWNAQLDAGQDHWDREFRIVRPDGELRWLQSVARAERNDDGTVRRVIGLNLDITDRKRRELEVDELNDQQRRLAERLQRAMLPDALTPIPGWQVAGRYLPGTDGLRVGGDWYDVISCGDHEVALVVGDVVGHNLEAAITMAQLRHATAALSHITSEPDEVLAGLDRLSGQTEEAFAATVWYGRLDTSTGHLRFARAGHPPPLLRRPDGTVTTLDEASGTPIGVHHARNVGTVTLQPDDVLVAFTDGLVEHRDRPINIGYRHLAEVLAAIGPASPLDQLIEAILGGMPGPNDSDDIAILAFRRTPSPE